ncbi:MAG: GtrA family protein [Planctomycetes bacterium]|jgi:putative flippase GtrA|nr:GtrA family protein [Planctomycetota bacterium]
MYEKAKFWLNKIFPTFYGLSQCHKSLCKFCIAGVMASIVDLLVLFIFHSLLHKGLILSTSLAFISSFMVSFYLQKFWTFRNPDRREIYRQISMYLLMGLFNLNINGILMHFFVHKFNIHYLLSQVITILCIGGESFIINKFIIFKNTCQNEITPCPKQPK